MTPEGTVKGKLDRRLKKLGVWFYSPQAGPHGQAGIPDRVLIVHGLFVGVECKRGAKHGLTELQKAQRQRILDAGGKYFVVYDDDTMNKLLEWIAHVDSEKQQGRCVACRTGHNHC